MKYILLIIVILLFFGNCSNDNPTEPESGLPTPTPIPKEWNCATLNAGFISRNCHTSVIYDNKMWVIGGFGNSDFLNDVWYSANGVGWVMATSNAAFTNRNTHTSVVYNNKMWVIGGYTDRGG